MAVLKYPRQFVDYDIDMAFIVLKSDIPRNRVSVTCFRALKVFRMTLAGIRKSLPSAVVMPGARPFRRIVSILPRISALAILIASPLPSIAINVAYHFGTSIAVNSSSPPTPVPITITGNGGLRAINVVTQGVANQDFTLVGGTCAANQIYFPGQTCTAMIQFQPKYAGTRQGAVILVASDGTILSSTLLIGTGLGATIGVMPAPISVVAGNGSWVYANDGEIALWTSFYLPMGGAVDGGGNIFVADSGNQRIRRIDAATTLVSTFVGNGNQGYGGDGGAATAAMLNTPADVKIDGAGNLYIADSGNQVVRMVNTTTGIISTIAGTGSAGYSGDGGPGTQASLSSPSGLAFDGDHILYIADTGNNAIRALDLSTGIISTIAGNGTAGFGGDGGLASSGMLNRPTQIALASDGTIYIADLTNNRIRKIGVDGLISTFAGNGSQGYTGFSGPAIQASFNAPAGVAVDAAGNVLIADSGSNVVRKVNPQTGDIETISGTLDGYSGLTTGGQYDGLYSIFLDAAGNIYVSDMFHQEIQEIGSSVTLTYAPMNVGGTSVPEPTIIENNGNIALNFSALLAQLDSGLDSATTTCSTSLPLAIGTSCTLGIEMKPTAPANYRSGSFIVESDALNSPTDVTLLSDVLPGNPSFISLNSSANPAITGSLVTFTASISISSQTAATGTVAFMDGTMTLGTVPVASGASATFSTSALLLGSHSITAVYSGDNQNNPSTSIPLAESVEQLTTVTIAASQNQSTVSSNLTFTAKAAGPSGSTMIPGGIITFLDGSTTMGSAAVNSNGVATFSTSALSGGQHYISAVYKGDESDVPSQSTVLPITISKFQTATALLASSASAYAASNITFMSTVSGDQGVTPAGTVTFMDGSTSLGVVALDAIGTASITVNILASGTHQITAVYGGNTTDQGSTSPTLIENIQQIPTSTLISSGANPANTGAALQLVATVAPNRTSIAPLGGLPTGAPFSGTVTFQEGGTVLGSAPVNMTGNAVLSVSTLSIGTHIIDALFSGNADYAASASSSISETIELATTTTSLTASEASVVVGTTVTLVAAATGNGGKPAGAITFMDGTTLLGTAILNSQGVASLGISTLTIGTHSLTALYAGNPMNSGSISSPIEENVQIATTNITLSSNENPALTLDPVTFTIRVSSNSSKVPTGTITLSDGSTILKNLTLDTSGSAAYTTTTLASGKHNVVSFYSGDNLNSPSQSALTQSIAMRTTTTAISSSATSLTGGQQVTLIGEVRYSGPVPPGGSIAFTNAGAMLGSGVVDPTGVSTLTINPLGSLSGVVASYSGDANYAASVSDPANIPVAKPTQFSMQMNPLAVSMQSRQHTTATLTLTSINGFADTLDFGCAGLPFAATCTFQSDKMVLPANDAKTVQVVIDTGSPLTAGPEARSELGRSYGPLLCVLPGGILICLGLSKRSRREMRLRVLATLLGCAGASMSVLLLSGCAGLQINATPAGHYTFQVTATGAGTGVQQAINVTMVVAQ